MLWLRRKLQKEVRDLDDAVKNPQGRQQMDVMDSVDDLGALMCWAMMGPAGRVLDLACIPTEVRGAKDLERFWDRLKTKCFIMLAKNFPDGILQLGVQSWFLAL